MANAQQIADFFLRHSAESGDFISNLKLQKLLYYAQGWHLAFFGKTLFEEDFEAWVHGPVIPAIYRKYKTSGWSPIQVNGHTHKPQLSSKVEALLVEIYEKYGSLDASQLERLTHREQPWKAARGNLAPDSSSRELISQSSMKSYFSSLLG